MLREVFSAEMARRPTIPDSGGKRPQAAEMNVQEKLSTSAEVACRSEARPAEKPWDMLQILNRFPTVNQASMRLTETASSFGRGLSTLLDDVGAPKDASSRQIREEKGHTTVSVSSSNVDQMRASTSSKASNLEVATTQNLTLEKATALLNSTSTTLTEFGQRLLGTPPLLWQGMVDRLQTTWRGSMDDIGWLRRMPGSAGVQDRTQRFGQILETVRHGVHSLPDDLVYLLVPGLFSNHGPLYFVDTKAYFSKLGLACHIAKIHSEAAVETNASVLKDYIEELYWGSGKQVAVLGHSKGGVDAAAAVAKHWPSLKDKVAGLVLVQSPYGGSPIASDLLREGQLADVQTRYVLELLIQKLVKGDVKALEDLTYKKRQNFLAKHSLPREFPVVSFHTEVSLAPKVLSAMSHIAHAELPWLPFNTEGASSNMLQSPTKLPVVIPLPAVMAMCAKHIELRYNHKSDGLVVREDAEAPGSVVVRPDRKLDHAWMVYSSARKDDAEADASQMCEALLTLLLETCKRTKAD